MSVFDDFGTTIRAVAATVGPSIVGVGRHGRGSGIVVADGRVVTNAHNLRGSEVTITFHDGRSTRGAVAGVDADGDLAVISVDTSGATPIAWSDGAALEVGTAVFGAAATASGTARVTVGYVSAVARAFRGPGGRRIAGSVEHTAPLAPGSSGGALVDGDGRLIGLNTNRIGEGFYLALPADESLRARVDALELRARDRQRKLIAKIDAALERIDDGTYGYCEETGEPISLKRLDARPIATLSVEAQERHERRERVYRDE